MCGKVGEKRATGPDMMYGFKAFWPDPKKVATQRGKPSSGSIVAAYETLLSQSDHGATVLNVRAARARPPSIAL